MYGKGIHGKYCVSAIIRWRCIAAGNLDRLANPKFLEERSQGLDLLPGCIKGDIALSSLYANIQIGIQEVLFVGGKILHFIRTRVSQVDFHRCRLTPYLHNGKDAVGIDDDFFNNHFKALCNDFGNCILSIIGVRETGAAYVNIQNISRFQ